MTKKLTILFISFTFYNAGYTQQSINDSLLVREWRLDSYTLASKTIPVTSDQKESRIFFNKDHTSLSITHGEKEVGLWNWNQIKRTITITSKKYPDIKTELYVEELLPEKMVVRVLGDQQIRITLKPARQNSEE